jgi:phage shock protein A
MNEIRKRIFPLLIALSALSVSASAAFYSVTGLTKLFAGAAFAVGIMAGSLEFAKLIIASLLYQYWDNINKVLRTYLTIAAGVLILITSAGIYGFLSSAYQDTANKEAIVEQQVAALETKKQLFEQNRDNYLTEKKSLTQNTAQLRSALTSEKLKGKKSFERQITSASKSDEKVTAKLDVVNDSIFALENRILEIKTASTTTSELGPLKYISNLTGQSMDKIINWFLLIIIFVFDPLAIALVIAANFAFAQIKKDNRPSLEESIESMKKVTESYDDLVEEIEKTKQRGVPLMVDPETNEIFYDSDDEEPQIVKEVVENRPMTPEEAKEYAKATGRRPW